eukprot:m.189584 g.189584  ORF g.189584 m.189584 type:complete len:1017 (-) comp17550_c0_seq2:745-3795(-)
MKKGVSSMKDLYGADADRLKTTSLLLLAFLLDEVEGALLRAQLNVGDLVGEGDAVVLVGVGQQLGAEGGGDVLGVARRLADHLGDGRAVGGVQSLVNLVEEVERSRVATLDGEDEREGHKRLLAAAELLQHVCLVALAGERHPDADACVLLDAALVGGIWLLGLRRLLVVLAALHHQRGLAMRHKLVEDLGKVLGHLLESALNCLVLLVVQHGDELLDLCVGLVLLALAGTQLFALLGEADVLIERFLVDVAELLQLLGDLGQLLVQLLGRDVLVHGKGLLRQRAELTDLAHALFLPLNEQRSLVEQDGHGLVGLLHLGRARALLLPHLVQLGADFLEVPLGLVGLGLDLVEPSLACCHGRLGVLEVRPLGRELVLKVSKLVLVSFSEQLSLPLQQIVLELRLERVLASLELCALLEGIDELSLQIIHLRLEIGQHFVLLRAEGRDKAGLHLSLEAFDLLLRRADRDLQILHELGLGRDALLREGHLCADRLDVALQLLKGRAELLTVRLDHGNVAEVARDCLVDALELLVQFAQGVHHAVQLGAVVGNLALARELGLVLVDKAALQRPLAAGLVALEGDAVHVVALGAVGGDRQRAADQRLAEDLVHDAAVGLVVLQAGDQRESLAVVVLIKLDRLWMRVDLVHRQKGHTAGHPLRVHDVQNMAGRGIRVDHHVENGVAGSDIHADVKGWFRGNQLDERAVHALDVRVLRQNSAHRVETLSDDFVAAVQLALLLLERLADFLALILNLLLLGPDRAAFVAQAISLGLQPRVVLALALHHLAARLHLVGALCDLLAEVGGLFLQLGQVLLGLAELPLLVLDDLADRVDLLLKKLVALLCRVELATTELLAHQVAASALAVLQATLGDRLLLDGSFKLRLHLLQALLRLGNAVLDVLQLGGDAALVALGIFGCHLQIAHSQLQRGALLQQLTPLLLNGLALGLHLVKDALSFDDLLLGRPNGCVALILVAVGGHGLLALVLSGDLQLLKVLAGVLQLLRVDRVLDGAAVLIQLLILR